MLSRDCQYCRKTFQVNHSDGPRDFFCSESCKNEYGGGIDKKSVCIICGEPFLHLGQDLCCSTKCFEQYVPEEKVRQSEESSCNYCGKSFERLKSSKHINYCSLRCKYQVQSKDSKENTVCNSKIVPKGWGREIHIVNHQDYCLKFLEFEAGSQFSLHWHKIKKELFLCILGSFEYYLERNGESKYGVMRVGDKIEIEPGTKHQLKALEKAIIIEVSTSDHPEDSFRDEKGD